MNEPTERSIASLRRLARGLVYDGASAEDVVQEAWLSALKRREALARPQGWLANAVRWCALRALRADERRGRHERAAARSEAAPETGELSGRTEVLRRLLDAVDRLPEPYRTAVHLRYLEDLPPRKIAQRLGLPVNTARTHVRRGLELLRKELDDGGRRREELLLALAPIVGPGAGLGSAAGLERLVARARESVSIASTPAKLAATLALAGAALFVGWRLIRQGEPREPAPAPHGVVTTTMEPGDERDSAPLRSPTTKSNAREPATPETSAVTAAWSVRGCVTRGGNEPFPLAQLVGRVHQGPGLDGPVLFSERFLADEFGEFVWAPPIAEHSTVYVTTDVPGHLASPSYDYILPGDPAAWGWSVAALPLDLEVRGVVRALDGSPIADAVVMSGSNDEFRRAVTDSEGTFRLSLWSQNTSLRVRAPGFEVAKVAADTNPLEIRLSPANPRIARVVDEQGRPIREVEIVRPGLDVKLRSDAEGRFPLHALIPPLTEGTLFLRHPDYSARRFQVPSNHTAGELLISLARGALLAGRVVNSEGVQVPGAWISLDSHNDEPRLETWSDAEGHFALTNALAGEHALWVWRNGYAHLRAEVVVVDGANSLELVLEPPHFVAGRVFGPAGPIPFAMLEAEDLPGAEDRIDGFYTWTDRDGNFRIEGLTEHGVRLVARADGCEDGDIVVDPLDREDLELRLQPCTVFAGRVIDDASRELLADFTVRSLIPPEFGARREAAWSVRGTNGEWRQTTRLATATTLRRIEVSAPGYAPLVLGPIESRWPVDPEACVARLAPGGIVRGRVIDAATGLGVADAEVARFPARTLAYTDEAFLGGILKTKSDATGAFELVDVPLGESELRVLHASYAPQLDGPFVVSQLATERTIDLSGGARFTGSLLDAAGNALAGETIDLSVRFAAGEKRQWRFTTTNDGRYSFEALSNGEYELFWMRPDGERHYPALSAALTLAPGAELTLDLQPRGSTRLTGTLTSGFELAGPATVRLTLDSNPPTPSPARSYGTLSTGDHFQLDHLEPGTYSLTAWAQLTDGRSAGGQTTVSVPASGALEISLTLAPR